MESEENCWAYEQGDSTNIPIIGVRLEGPRGCFPSDGEVSWRVDTGYDGFMLIDESLYGRLRLKLSEIPKASWVMGRTVTGQSFILRRASVIVHIPKIAIQLEGQVETFKGNRENLLGLAFLRMFRFLLNGIERKGCIFNHHP